MKPYAILDADCAGRLIAADKIEVIQKLFGSAVITPEVRKELLSIPYTNEWAKNPPSWVSIRSPQEIDKGIVEHNTHSDNRKIDLGEAESISLAKEIAAENKGMALVISNDGAVRDYLNAERQNQKVFATNFWSVVCQAADAGLINLEKERPELERFNQPGSAEKHRDRILELDSPDARLLKKGFTPEEKIEQFCGYLQEKQKQQIQNQENDRKKTKDMGIER